MNICEQFILGKKNDPTLCEDGIFINDNFIAVLDGVTSKSARLFNGKAGGRTAMESAVKVLSEAEYDVSKELLFLKINEAIKELYNDTPTGEAAVCIAVFSKYHKEIWAMGDCQFLVNGEHHCQEKEIDKILSEIRALVLEAEEKKGSFTVESDPGREFIMPILKIQHIFANSKEKYGYPLLNGDNIDTNEIYSVKINDGDIIVLASDGYPTLCESLKESEEKLSEILKNDPMLYKIHLSTKGVEKGNISFDDRAYIKFTV